MGWPLDKYEGTLVLPGASAAAPTSPSTQEVSVFDSVVIAIERLYEREPKLTHDLLDVLRATNIDDLERLFR